MRRILEFIRPHYARMAVGLSIKFIGTIMELFLPWILSYMIDDVIPTGRMDYIFMWGGAMIVCSLICIWGNISANRRASAVARETTRSIRHALFEKISYLSSAQIDRITVPSLVSRLTTDTYNMHHMVGMAQRMGVRAPILLLGGLIMTLTLDVPLTGVLAITVPLIGTAVTIISRKGVPMFRQLQTRVDGLIRVIRENVTGARVIKALSMNRYEMDRFSGQNKYVADGEVRANLIMGMSNPVMNILLNIGLVLVILMGAHRVNENLMAAGKIVAFLSYFTIITNGMMAITRIFVIMSRSTASADRIAEILNMEEDLTVSEGEAEDSGCHVEFENVTFSYNKRKPTLENLSFKLRRGESLGVIGATGSGKSTIVNLLMRFYDTDEGAIRIGGRDVKTIPSEELHTMFGVAFQNDVIFSDTVRENIDMGRGLTDNEIETAAENAQAAHFISELPEKFTEHLNAKGTNLSGGQRQRLLISRALAGHPDILVLDDSSSALDYRTDANLRMALNRNYDDVTTIMIASRVSSIANCTEIIVLDEGRVIGQGTHEELLKTCDTYREIAETQMGGM